MLWNDPDAPTRVFLARLEHDLARLPLSPGVEARRAFLQVMADKYGPAPSSVARVEDVFAKGRAGQVPVRLYFPHGAQSTYPLPLMVHLHGGGWALGDAKTYERVCRAYCAAGRCIVADVQYRRAPENKFPAAIEDCETALSWLAGHTAAMGADTGRIVVVGDSAGGALAAVLCRRTRVPVALQILLYPMTTVSTNADYPSRRRFGGGKYFLTQSDIDRAREEYCSQAVEVDSPDVSPLLARDVSHVPPALIVTAGLDPLRDEGAAYARHLKAAGVRVEYICVPRTIHAFVLFAGAIPKGMRTIARIGHTIRTVKPCKF